MIFRKTLFWIHLAMGISAGLAIAIMCLTGTVLAFEKQLVGWAERDARQVVPPGAHAVRLSVDDMIARVRAIEPGLQPVALTLSADPAGAVAVAITRDRTIYVNPYTGETRAPASGRMRERMRTLLEWHRFLGRNGDQRPLGKLLNGIANIVFLGLAVTGLYLWWPRSLSWRALKANALFKAKLAGRAREFNWHNVMGLWSAPILIVLTLTAVPMSFRWGSNLIYLLGGEQPPAVPGPGHSADAAPQVNRPTPGARPLGRETIIANVQQQFPRWQQINLRLGGAQRGRPTPASVLSSDQTKPPRQRTDTSAAVAVSVRMAGSWPRTATTALTIDPFSGIILKREGQSDLSPARRMRSWTRFLHTGEALGPGGQLVAGLASLAGCFLVYTGCALSWRRFFSRRRVRTAPQA